MWTNYQNDLILDDHLVFANHWPAEAHSVMDDAGNEPAAGAVSYGEAQPDAAERARLARKGVPSR